MGAAMRGENAARQRFSVQRTLHHGRYFSPGISSKSRWRGESADASSENVRRAWRITRIFCRKKKWGWMPKTQIALSASKIATVRRKEHEWYPWCLQNDSRVLKRKSARFRCAGRERLADISDGGWRRSRAQRALRLLAAVFFLFLNKQSLTGAGLYCML